MVFEWRRLISSPAQNRIDTRAQISSVLSRSKRCNQAGCGRSEERPEIWDHTAAGDLLKIHLCHQSLGKVSTEERKMNVIGLQAL